MELLKEGVYDPGIFKAMIVVGGPGSGKSNLINNIGIKALGLKHVVSDHFFELLLKKNNKSFDLSKAGDYSGERERAQVLTNKKEQLYVDGRLGIVYESTLSSVEKAMGKIKVFRQSGYEVKLVYVSIDKKTAMERNKKRRRNVPAEIVLKRHADIDKNMEFLTKTFKKEDTHLVRSGTSEFADDIKNLYKELRTWITRPPKTAKAKAWIAEKTNRSVVESNHLLNRHRHMQNNNQQFVKEYVEARGGIEELSEDEKSVLVEMAGGKYEFKKSDGSGVVGGDLVVFKAGKKIGEIVHVPRFGGWYGVSNFPAGHVPKSPDANSVVKNKNKVVYFKTRELAAKGMEDWYRKIIGS